MTRPIFEHDCDACQFLGHVCGYDIYTCPQGGIRPTIVARWGHDGPEYTSGRTVDLGGVRIALPEERRGK